MLQWKGLLIFILFSLSLHGDTLVVARPGTKRTQFPVHVEKYEDTLTWAVILHHYDDHHDEADVMATQVAMEIGLENLGRIGHLRLHYLFYFPLGNSSYMHFTNGVSTTTADAKQNTRSNKRKNFRNIHSLHLDTFDSSAIGKKIVAVERRLDRHPLVATYSHQKIRNRQKRRLMFKDPYYYKQWHLTNYVEVHNDINITGVWELGVTGKGVTVAVVDDGLEWNNPDLVDNYNKAGSWDLNDDDPDPTPDSSKESNHHGTRCAGEIGAVPNDICSVGVAHGAKISGFANFGWANDGQFGSFSVYKNFQINDIYSCSWGPDDDGRTIDGPHTLAAAAMKYGIDFGRHGYGNIYVVASGNGGTEGDNCNYDGYANSLYTVTIGAVDEKGRMPFYAEECASMLAVTFSSGGMGTRDIVTTDWTKSLHPARSGCTEHHTGTSAAAPIAAGLVALMLEVQPCLTWRDVQYLIILTAQKVDVDVAHWQKNGAGLWHSHKHGFGLMKAWRMVNAAAVWDMVPWLTSYSYARSDINLEIPKGRQNPLQISYTVKEEETNGFDLFVLETVQVTLTLTHPCRGYLQIQLTSPHGTWSMIGATRSRDNSTLGFDQWTFSTVRCWGETPAGNWTLTITDTDTSTHGSGFLKAWELKLYGTPMSVKQFRHRKRLIEDAMHGNYLLSNQTRECPPPPVSTTPNIPMSQKALKMIGLVSAFCFVLAIYETFESLLCYNEEKKEHSKLQNLVERAHRLAGPALNRTHANTELSSMTERTGLLGAGEEHIPLQSFHTSGDLDLYHDHDPSGTLTQETELYVALPQEEAARTDLISGSNTQPACQRNGEISVLSHSRPQNAQTKSKFSIPWGRHGYARLPDNSDDEEVLFDTEDQRTRSFIRQRSRSHDDLACATSSIVGGREELVDEQCELLSD